MSLETIQAQLKDPNLEHGSPEELRLREEARSIRKKETDEYSVVHRDQLEAAAAEHGVIRREAAQHAAHVAVEQVTGEYQIPVQAGPAPGEVFDQARH